MYYGYVLHGNGRCYSMDEKNLNSMPVDSVDDEDEKVASSENETEVMPEEVQTEQTDETEATENEEAAEEAETQEDKVVSEENDSEQAEEDDLTIAEIAEPVKKKKKGRGAKITIAVLVLIMIAAIAVMISSIIKSENAKLDLDQVVLSVANVDSSAAEFYQSYMYYYSYNSYYQYSDEELKDLAIDQLVLTNSLYTEALAKGYTVTKEIQSQIDAQLDGITATAESSSMTADEYLDQAFCPGFTLDMYKEILEKSIIAQTYYTDKMESIEKQYSGNNGKTKIEAEYEANKLDYDLTDVSYWYFAASEEDAQANADAIVKQVKNGKSFDAAVKSVTGDSEAEPNDLKGHSKATLENSSFVKEAVDWIFAANEDGTYENGKGSVTSIADESKIYVFYVNNAPQRDEIYPVDVCYIQVDVSKDDAVKTEKELKIEAKATADAIVEEFEATDKSIESFSAIVEKYNNGDNDLVSGDVFEGMRNDGSEDASIEEWAFAENRKEGNYTLVEGEDCYYILFFAHKAENAVWYDTILNSLLTDEARNFEETILAENEEKTETNEDAINEVIAYVANMVAAQYGY